MSLAQQSDPPSVVAFDVPPFGHGDCGDAALGTVLRSRGCAEPDVVLFKTWAFFAEAGTAAGFQLFGYRDDPALERDLATWLDVSVVEHRFTSARDFVDAAVDLARRGRIPIVRVDHFEYQPSHLYRRRHLQHKILLVDALSSGEIRTLDPFPAFQRQQDVTSEQLLAWARPHPEIGRGFALFDVQSPRVTDFDPDLFLLDTAEVTLRANVARMSPRRVLSTGGQGVEAIRKLALCLEAWLLGDESHSVAPVPILGLYDVGAARICHGKWLRRLDRAFGFPPRLVDCARQIEEAGRQWNILNSLRAMHDTAIDAPGERRRFVERQVRSLPNMIRQIAEVESAAADALNQAMERLG